MDGSSYASNYDDVVAVDADYDGVDDAVQVWIYMNICMDALMNQCENQCMNPCMDLCVIPMDGSKYGSMSEP